MKKLQIGNVTLDNPIILAPMAGGSHPHVAQPLTGPWPTGAPTLRRTQYEFSAQILAMRR